MSASPPMRVHFALLDEPQQSWEGEDNLRKQEEILRRHSGNFVPTPDPAEADFIVFLVSNNYKSRHFIPRFLREELVHAHPQKVYALNYRAEPITFFPGVYTSVPRCRFDESWVRAGGYYLGNPNPFLSEYEHRPWNPRHTACFSGAMSHPVRRQLLGLAPHWGPGFLVKDVRRWFDHNEAEQREYLQEIVDSRFVLCPRGLATSSHRMYEVMQLGRVPVVIADEWVRPNGPDWESFAIFVAEDAMHTIPSVLQAMENDAEAMGRRAQSAWEEWFSPKVALRRQIEEIASLAQARKSGAAPNFERIWNSPRFFRQHGWALDQRIFAKIRKLFGPQTQ